MPYVANFKSPDFLCKHTVKRRTLHLILTIAPPTDATVEISMWSTVEVGVSICAANLATIRPLIHHFTHKGESWESRQNRPGHAALATIPDSQELPMLKMPPKTAESSITCTDPKSRNGESGMTRSVSNWSRWTRKDSAANVDVHVL